MLAIERCLITLSVLLSPLRAYLTGSRLPLNHKGLIVSRCCIRADAQTEPDRAGCKPRKSFAILIVLMHRL